MTSVLSAEYSKDDKKHDRNRKRRRRKSKQRSKDDIFEEYTNSTTRLRFDQTRPQFERSWSDGGYVRPDKRAYGGETNGDGYSRTNRDRRQRRRIRRWSKSQARTVLKLGIYNIEINIPEKVKKNMKN